MAITGFAVLDALLVMALSPFVLLLIFTGMCVVTVPVNNVAIMERFGKKHKVLNGGWHIVIPLIDELRTIHWLPGKGVGNTTKCIPLSEQFYDPPPFDLITKDRIRIKLDLVVVYSISDAEKAFYNVENMKSGLEHILLTGSREACASLTVDEIMFDSTEKNKIVNKVISKFGNTGDDWGLSIKRIEIQSILPSNEIMKAAEELIMTKKKADLKALTEDSIRTARLLEEESRQKLDLMETKNKADTARLKLDSDIQAAEAKLESDMHKKQREAETEAQAIKLRADAFAYRAQKETEADVLYTKSLRELGMSEGYFTAKVYAQSFNELAKSKGTHLLIPYESAKFFGAPAMNTIDMLTKKTG